MLRTRPLPLAALCGATLLVPALPALGHAPDAAVERAPHRVSSAREGSVRAADLLRKLKGCTRISHGRYRSDEGRPATIPVCGKGDAVYWKADLDIDCDGRASRHCSRRTDPTFTAMTAYPDSKGRQLSSERLPYVVIPGASRIWRPAAYGIRGGTLAVVLYRDKVQYAVVGDVGPKGVIGEASYATAVSLGINPHPVRGGAPTDVTYLLFKNTIVRPIESHAAAVALGETRARKFLGDN
ncbi:glycoside hydrolase family 75 protein [Streptomyces sp. NPDC046821]|uniref:glycoside hydrolase family 75 protein n=1 Tax=Streptomyces sp. NPDC046821 TaxID=3154702 RepID=UPI0033F9E7E7